MRIIFFVLSTLIITSCGFLDKKVKGNGNVITEKKDLKNFHSIYVAGAMNVQVRQAPQNAVSISTDENLIQYLELFVDDNILIVRQREGYNLQPTKGLILYASAPDFRDITVSGSGDIRSENTIISNEPLSIQVSGSGDIDLDVDLASIHSSVSGSGSVNLSGRTDVLDIDISGSGDIRCFDLISNDVSLDLSGSSDAEVTANRKLNVSASGSADVLYKGNAAVTKSISGSGSVRKVN